MDLDPSLRGTTTTSTTSTANSRSPGLSQDTESHAPNTQPPLFMSRPPIAHGSEYPDPPVPSHFAASSSTPVSASSNYYPHPHIQSHLHPHANQHLPEYDHDHDHDHDRDPDHDPDHPDPNDPYSDLKRPRACEACRQLKVRCEPDPTNQSPSCKRCAKAGRSCVVTVPTRKRQKKTDSRVAELERKIDALTASLTSGKGQGIASVRQAGAVPAMEQSHVGGWGAAREEYHGRRWLGPGGQTQGQVSAPTPTPAPTGGSMSLGGGTKRDYSGEVLKDRTSSGPAYPHEYGQTADGETVPRAARHNWRSPGNRVESLPPIALGTETGGDVIERGLVSYDSAVRAFDRYVNEMARHIPMVVFPAGTEMSDVRRTKPVLLHAIIAIAVGPIQPEAQTPLLNDFYKIIAERIVVKGEKTLELAQSLLVCCNWYLPPDHFEQLKFYQLSHMAATLCIDLGMYRKTMPKSKSFNVMRDVMGKRSTLDLDAAETRRTWLGCYFISVQVSTSLRRPILVRWHPYMDECIEILESSPDALPSDAAIIHWAKLSRILEEISLQFSMDDMNSSVSFSDPKFQYTLKVFEKQLEQWKKEIPPEQDTPMMPQAECIVNLFMHESAMHLYSGSDGEPKAPGEEHSNPITPAHMSALSTCLTSIHQALETICSIDLATFNCLPTVALARTSFAVVGLVKLYSLASAPETQLGQVIEPSSLKVEYYLDKVIKHYTTAGEFPGARTPAKFSNVLSMLRTWFMKRKDQPALKEAFGTKMFSSCVDNIGQEESSQHNKPGQTPLHLLSEIATGEPKNESQSPYAPRPGLPYESISHSQSSDLISPTQALSASAGATPASRTSLTAGGTTDSDTASWTPTSYHQHQQQPSTRPYPAPLPPFTSPYNGVPDPSSSTANGMVMPGPGPGPAEYQGFFVSELGLQVGADPENLFALENMLGDGFLNLPLPADGGLWY